MNELALFAGVGGGVLGGRLLGWRSVCYVEKDAYCVKILRARIAEGYLCDAPIWGDIKTFDGRPWSGCVDIITAGFPCQPFSVAGKRKGADDDRNLWPETLRVIREVRPRYAFCENVPGLIGGDHGYFGRILNDLSESGYDARWRIVSAADVGAPHLRKRLWILASMVSANKERCGWVLPEREGSGEGMEAALDGSGADATLADSHEFGRRRRDHGDARGQDGALQTSGSCPGNQQTPMADPHDAGWGTERISINSSPEYAATELPSWWDNDPAEDATESQVGRVAHGVPDRVGQLRALGNAQVPGVARLAWRLLTNDEYT